MRRRSASMIGATILGLALAGCAQGSGTSDQGPSSADSGGPVSACGSDQTVTIKWQNWISEEDATRQFTQDAINAFEKKCPNITIQSVGVPAEKTPQAISLAATSNSGADLFQTSMFYTPQFTTTGPFMDVSSLLSDLKTEIVPKSVENGTWDDKWTNVEWGIAPFFLTYNKNVMKEAGFDPEKPPKTMDELIRMSEEIGQKGNGKYYGYCQDSGNNEVNGIWTQIYLMTMGGALATADYSAPTVDSDTNVAALTAYQKWYNTPGAWAQGIDVRQCRDLFATNKVAFNFESSWATGIYRSGSGQGEAFDSQWGAVPVPEGPDGNPGVAVDGSQGLAIASYSEHPEVAAAFIRFMVTDPTITSQYLQQVGFPSPVMSLWTQPDYQTPIVQAMLKSAPNAYQFNSAHYTDLITAFGETLQTITANNADVKQALGGLQQKFEAVW